MSTLSCALRVLIVATRVLDALDIRWQRAVATDFVLILFCADIFNYIVALTGVFGTTKIRRRPMMLLAWFGVLMSNIGIIATTSTFDRNGNNHAAIGTVAMIWTYDLFFNFVCGPLFFR